MTEIWMPDKLVRRPVGALRPYEGNARIHDADQIKELRESFRAFGFLVPLLINAQDELICGHGRLLAAIAEGLTEVPCILAENLTEEQRIAFILADNRLAEHSRWDKALVSAALIRLRDSGFDIKLTGFATTDIILDVPADPFEDDGFDPTPQEDECVEPGSLWALGDHRLLVGDATVMADVARLMGGQAADLLLTDPPYGVDYTGGTSKALKIENDDLSREQFLSFLKASFSNAKTAMRPGAVFYVWHPDGDPALEFRLALRSVGLTVRQCLVWVKNSFVISRQDYHWQHEPCLEGQIGVKIFEPCVYGWQSSAGHAWHSDRKQTTVLEFDRPVKSLEHPTMKPVKLFAYQICNSTVQGDRVLDLFAGSGTTLIACEQLRRKAFCMEKDGRYAAVIIRRWESLTGRKAEPIRE